MGAPPPVIQNAPKTGAGMLRAGCAKASIKRGVSQNLRQVRGPLAAFQRAGPHAPQASEK